MQSSQSLPSSSWLHLLNLWSLRQTRGGSQFAMPRRRALTETQLETLLALPIDEAALVQYWTLSVADLVEIERRRRGHNRLGFAVQLCALRYPGRLLRADEIIPANALRFVAGPFSGPAT
jgi:TnpA family transposase